MISWESKVDLLDPSIAGFVKRLKKGKRGDKARRWKAIVENGR